MLGILLICLVSLATAYAAGRTNRRAAFTPADLLIGLVASSAGVALAHYLGQGAAAPTSVAALFACALVLGLESLPLAVRGR